MKLMLNKKYFYFAFLLGIMACSSSTELIEQIDEEDGGKISYTRRTDNFGKQGLYTKWTKEGKKYEEAMYENDTLHGARKLYFENGDLQIIEHYKMGIFDGTWAAYHENGKIKLEGAYIDNSMEGPWKGYYDNGAKKEEVLFKNNNENGPFVEYFKNGKIKAEGTYLDGDNEDGLLKIYEESGALIKKMDCKKGICRTIWTKEEGEVIKKD